jgi:hypothetical protein
MDRFAADFESAWSDCPKGYAIFQRRVQRYDRAAGMFYAPAEYAFAPVQPTEDLPSQDWVSNALSSFVRGEFSDDLSPAKPFSGFPSIEDAIATGREPERFLECCEEELVYGKYFQEFLFKVDDEVIEGITDEVIKALYFIVADEKLGNKKNRNNVDPLKFQENLMPILAKRHRIQFVMPAFPFKDQNPFRTESPPGAVDLGEIALMIRLHALALAMYQVHPQGSDWILVSDGEVYSGIFGIEQSDARKYRERLREWRDVLNLQGTVSVVDLGELAQRINGIPSDLGNVGIFDSVCTRIREAVSGLNSEADPGIIHQLKILKRGMTWNLNLREYQGRVSDEELWLIAKAAPTESIASQVGRDISTEVQARALEAALSYAAFNLALRYLDAFQNYLPGTMRATIHPKKGQIAVPSLGTCFPWNGIPVVNGAVRHDNIDVMPLSETLKRTKKLRRHRAPGIEGCFYYSLDEQTG